MKLIKKLLAVAVLGLPGVAFAVGGNVVGTKTSPVVLDSQNRYPAGNGSLITNLVTPATSAFNGGTITGALAGTTVTMSTMAINGPLSSIGVAQTTAPLTVAINGNATNGSNTALLCSGTGNCAIITQTGIASGYVTWENVSTGNNGRLYICNNSASAADRGCIIFANDSDAVIINSQNTEGLRVKNGQVNIGPAANPSNALSVNGAMDVSGATKLAQKTIAQLMAITPAVGDAYICTNCTLTYDVVTGTGATLGGFRESGTNHGPQ